MMTPMRRLYAVLKSSPAACDGDMQASAPQTAMGHRQVRAQCGWRQRCRRPGPSGIGGAAHRHERDRLLGNGQEGEGDADDGNDACNHSELSAADLLLWNQCEHDDNRLPNTGTGKAMTGQQAVIAKGTITEDDDTFSGGYELPGDLTCSVIQAPACEGNLELNAMDDGHDAADDERRRDEKLLDPHVACGGADQQWRRDDAAHLRTTVVPDQMRRNSGRQRA